MRSGAGWSGADEGHARLKQVNVRQEAWRQRGRVVRKELQRRGNDYEQQERDPSTEKEMSRRKEMSETKVEADGVE